MSPNRTVSGSFSPLGDRLGLHGNQPRTRHGSRCAAQGLATDPGAPHRDPPTAVQATAWEGARGRAWPAGSVRWLATSFFVLLPTRLDAAFSQPGAPAEVGTQGHPSRRSAPR